MIPKRLEMQWMQGRQLMREPLCGTSFILMNTTSKRADLFSVLPMMHEAGGWKSILMPVSGVRWIWADIGIQTIRAASLDPTLAEGFLQAVIDVDPQPLIFLVPVHEYYDEVLFLWGYFFFKDSWVAAALWNIGDVVIYELSKHHDTQSIRIHHACYCPFTNDFMPTSQSLGLKMQLHRGSRTPSSVQRVWFPHKRGTSRDHGNEVFHEADRRCGLNWSQERTANTNVTGG